MQFWGKHFIKTLTFYYILKSPTLLQLILTYVKQYQKNPQQIQKEFWSACHILAIEQLAQLLKHNVSTRWNSTFWRLECPLNRRKQYMITAKSLWHSASSSTFSNNRKCLSHFHSPWKHSPYNIMKHSCCELVS